jgi:hypothetical protein
MIKQAEDAEESAGGYAADTLPVVSLKLSAD